MVRTSEVDDEPAANPPTFADLIDTVDDLEEGDHIRVTYAHKSRHTNDEPDLTTTVDGYVTVADVTGDDPERRRFRLETQGNDPEGPYTGAKHRIKTGGVNKTESNPCYVSKSTGPSVRDFQQLGRVDSIEVVEEDDTEDDVATDGGVDVRQGDVFKTDLGERMEITNERDDDVCVHFPEREAPEGTAYTVWRPAESVAAQVAYEDMDRIDDDRDDEDDTFPGEFTDKTPRCPECSRFMSTGYDGMGHPAAQCSRPDCPGHFDDRELIDGGYFEEA